MTEEREAEGSSARALDGATSSDGVVDSSPRAARSAIPPLEGLARLAFGSFTRIEDVSKAQHLALLHDESLELDLNDPLQRQFGDYELLERIGEGGMGVVYRARHLPLDRIVAVKLLSAGPWASQDFIARFEREAQHAARMQHPNIVTVFEAGSHDGLHFFSMPLVEGRSLSMLLKAGERFSPRRAAALMRTVAEAVAYAHSVGVLHLDLKPGNILLGGDGTPYVTDFGLARRLDGTSTADNDEVSGTPAYMAPEQTQLHSRKLTAATDIWELGAILYELLAGTPPFRGSSAADTLKLVLEGQVRAPRRWRPNLPLDLQAIALKCLRKDPQERYADARALADDLSRFLEGRPVQARPLNAAQRAWRWARREPKLAAVTFLVFAVLVGGLLATLTQAHRAKANADRATHTLWNARTATAQKLMAKGDAYPALAEAVANLREMEAHGDRGDAVLERLRIGTVLANAPQLIDVIPLASDDFVNALAISPDAKTLAAVTGGGRSVRLFNVATGKQVWQVDTANTSFGSMDFYNQAISVLRFSTDGRRLIGYTIDTVPGGDQSTMRPRVVDSVMIDVPAGKVVTAPKAFPDFLATAYGDEGRYALLFDRHGGIQRWRTQPWAPAGDKVVFKDNINNAPHDGPLMGAARLADAGRIMVFGNKANLAFQAYDAEHMRLLHSLVLDTARGRATAWALSEDSKQLAIGTVTGQVALWDLESGDVAWLASQLPGRIATLRFSPDDSRLLALSNAPSEVRVFDTASHALVAEPVKLGDDSQPNIETGVGAMFGADAQTLLTSHWTGGATLWRLPAPGFPLRAPVPIAPQMNGMGTRFAVAQAAGSRLLASSDNGTIKLWRLHPPALMDRVAAPMVAATLHFDGQHLVSVTGNRVSVFDVAAARTVGKVIALPEAPTFAGLDASGQRLIVIVGREVSCWHWRDGTSCWPAISLPDSPLRLGMAARAPLLAVSTGSNAGGHFFESVRVIDLASGHELAASLKLRGPLAALRLSADGRRLLAWEDSGSRDPAADVLHVIDTRTLAIAMNLTASRGDHQQDIYDAQFAPDGSLWAQSGDPWNTVSGGLETLWHWSAQGELLRKLPDSGNWVALQTVPGADAVITLGPAQRVPAVGAPLDLVTADAGARVAASAVSPDGHLLALATLDGVALTDIPHNQRLLPDLKLPLPYHEVVQQLAFAPDGSRLVGRTTGGRWFAWRIVADARAVSAIARSVALHDLAPIDVPAIKLSAAERQQLRAADPGPMRAPPAQTAVTVADDVSAPTPDPRYTTLDLAPIANVDPRLPMTHMTRLPPQPQSLPSLPHGLQRYDGVDFVLGRAVQLSGQPQSVLDTEYPSTSRRLDVGARRVAALDVLALQYLARIGTVGSVHLHYVDGSERVLDITSPGEVREHWMDSATNPATLRVGWLGSFAAQMLIDGSSAIAPETLSRSYVVRLVNPEPERPLASISFSTPADVSPGLLFLAVTLEPAATPGRDTR